MEWIKCSDRKPNQDEKILTYHISNEAFRIGYFIYEEDGFDYYFDDANVFDITHWMPLPNPPEDKNDDDIYDRGGTDTILLGL